MVKWALEDTAMRTMDFKTEKQVYINIYSTAKLPFICQYCTTADSLLEQNIV